MLSIRRLRSFLLSAFVTNVVFGVGSVPASAQPAPIPVVVDENGHGTIFVLQPLPFSIIPDPGPGGLPNVLAYELPLPFVVNGGDVVLSDSDGVSSDLVRFAGQTLFFYSDQNGASGALADIGLPTGRNTRVVTLPEVPLAQGFGAIYTPTSTQPGFHPAGISYTFISDPIQMPESASLFLLLMGGAALLGLGVLRGRT